VVLAVSAGSSSRVARIATTGMTTDVYPRENCLAPDYESTQYDYPHRRERYCTQEGHTREMGVGRDGRVIDLHVLTRREGGRRRGREGCRWGVVLRGEDARG
jgi:hypothetical protein